jgi:predicted dithiol-disulfide oxidoreductase (DUF899 family)
MCPACISAAALAAAGSFPTAAAAFAAAVVKLADAAMPLSTGRSSVRRTHVVSRQEWLAARIVLLAQEKELTRQRDALAEARRRLPLVRVTKDYRLEGPAGHTTLCDLFGNHPQLIVYHFMFDPQWSEGCPSCSHCADNFAGAVVHLAARNTAFAAVSRAPIHKIESFRRRMGWTFPWFSSHGTDFNYDFHVTLAKAAHSIEYNFSDAETLQQAGKLWTTEGELPGLSVFLRDGNETFHSYSAYARGLDVLLNTYNYLDLTPLGRQDLSEGNPQGWIRHHDRYAT